MREFYQQLLQYVGSDTKVLQLGGEIYSAIGSSIDAARVRLTRFPIELMPLGVSQTSSAGPLNLLYYFALKIVCTKRADASTYDEGDFIELGEYLAATVHLLRLEGKTAFLSKMMTVHSSFILQNNNRRINVKLNDNQSAHILFFWASAKTAAELQEAGSVSSKTTYAASPGGSTSSDTSTEGTSTDEDSSSSVTSTTSSADLLAYASENLFP